MVCESVSCDVESAGCASSQARDSEKKPADLFLFFSPPANLLQDARGKAGRAALLDSYGT